MRKFGLLLLLLLLGATGTVSLLASSSSQPNAIFSESSFKSGYYFYSRRNYAAAIGFFDKAISYNAHDYRSRIWLGQSYFMAGFLKSALTEWQSALNLGEGGNLLRSKLNNLFHIQGKESVYNYSTPYIFLKSYSGYRNKKLFYMRPTGVAIDKANRMYIAGFKNGVVVVLDPNGTIIRIISSGLKRPYDIAFAPDGSFYVSDFGGDKVVRYNSQGKKIATIGSFGYKPGQFAGPEGLCCDKYGNLFVVDSGNNRVQKFSPEGKFLLQFGRKGRYNGQFYRPADVLWHSGKIIVSDNGNTRLQVFDESGNFLKILGKGKLSDPRGLHQLHGGRIVVADGRRGIVIYNPKDSSWRRVDALVGKVNRAVGVAADKNNMLYIADFGAYHVNVFIPERMKYVNLDVRIVRSLDFEFPNVQHYVTVRDREGRPIQGLKKANFRVFERGVNVRPISLAPTYRYKDRTSMVFLVDKSTAMQPHQESMQRVMRSILKNLTGHDKVAVMNYNSKVWVSQPYISNILSPLEGARKGAFESSAKVGPALYKGVTQLFKYEYRPALVLFTTGTYSEDDYKPYGFLSCLHYAKNNGIPVYLVLFGRGPDTARLEQLVKETGGQVYDALTSSSVHRLRDTIMRRPLSFYSLFYKTAAHPKMRGSYREFTVEVNYKGLFGYDKFGYYIPK